MAKLVPHSGPKILHHMTTTAFLLEGHTVTQTLGVVMGITVRSRSVIGNVGAVIQVFFGGRIENFISLCEKARQEAFELMLQHAEQTGGNAVVGVRYDANEIMNGVTEVLCYGTAVVAEPVG
ncbi:MAG TPA: YbjQ family protein [Gemmatimonadales bacterium]|nr:YbjQ family protein [Gemmatimonadales bacterium]